MTKDSLGGTFRACSRDSAPITIDCSVPEGEPSPLVFIHHADARRPEDFDKPGVNSFGQLVIWWIEAWDDGIYDYDADSGK